jgi:replicative DNA helicase
MTGGGLHAGELAFVGARTSIGKSVLAGQVALAAARSGRRVAFFTLEMAREQMGARFLLSEGGARAWALGAGGDVGREAWAKVDRAAGELEGLPILWDHTPTLTVAAIRAKCRAAAADGALGLVVVDYFQRIAVEGKADRWVQLGNVARGLKSLARELACPLLVPAQLNREAEGRRPSLADLRECGDVEQEGDVVVLLHRDRDDGSAVVPTEAIVGKNRQGPTGDVVVGFKRDEFKFVGVAGGER